NILTIDMQQNKAAVIEKELLEIAEVKQLSKSNHISSVGESYSPGHLRYQSMDSVRVFYNFVDENYIPLHEHKLLAGQNFNSSMTTDSHVIVNEKAASWMKLSTLQDAIGQEIIIDNKKMKIIGVIQDFNHDRINHPIQPFAFRSDASRFQVMSLKIQSTNILATMDKITATWRKIDPIHPLKAEFYNDRIANSYNKMSWLAKIIGSVAFLAIFIASLGLLGMVIFTTETRLKEISIRKVLGASEGKLIVLMSRGFIQLLLVSAAIAIPSAYYLFDQIIFNRFAYRAPIGVIDLFGGAIAVMAIAFLMISTQTLKVARTNPAQVLKSE
ncbi:MAG TPA: FtsX-like permease family protein, partial [Cyclobacteriaceae bacterium]